MNYGVDQLQSSLSGIIVSDQIRFEASNEKEENSKGIFVAHFGLFTKESRIYDKSINGILGINRF
jgi:hypothetical protein